MSSGEIPDSSVDFITQGDRHDHELGIGRLYSNVLNLNIKSTGSTAIETLRKESTIIKIQRNFRQTHRDSK